MKKIICVILCSVLALSGMTKGLALTVTENTSGYLGSNLTDCVLGIYGYSNARYVKFLIDSEHRVESARIKDINVVLNNTTGLTGADTGVKNNVFTVSYTYGIGNDTLTCASGLYIVSSYNFGSFTQVMGI